MRFRAIHAVVMTAALSMPLTSAAAVAHAATTPTPPFTQCPAVGQDPSCQLLLVVNADNTITVLGDPALGPYDGSDDTLIGIVNTSKTAVPAITVTGPGSGLAGLDGDGLCTYTTSGCPFGPTGYEGPGTSIKTDPTLPDSAEIDFTGAGLKPGTSAYFSLEGALTAASITSRPGTLSTCAPVYYIGARGSGETGPGSKNGWDKANDPSGFGPEVNDVYAHLQSALGSGNIQADPLNYAADPVPSLSEIRKGAVTAYFNDLSAGVTQAENDLKQQASSCPGQEIIMAGYSQGAMVMHRVLHQLDGSASGKQILSRVAAAALVADGDQVSLDREVMDGSAWHIAYGIGQVDRAVSGSSGAKFSRSLGSRIIRVCNGGDLVCDFGTAAGVAFLRAGVLHDLNKKDYTEGVKVHTSYPNSKPLLQAGQQAARDAQKLSYYGGGLVIKGTVGQPISASAVVIGGKAPLTVFVGIDGTVPSWLALGMAANNTMTLGGTPPAAGSWKFEVEVQDAGNNVVTIPVSLTVG